MQQMSSAITGALALAETRLKSTGQPPSETASVPSLTESEARAKLLASKPEETDQRLLTWLKSLGVGVCPEVRLTYPAAGGYRRELTGYSFSGITEASRRKAAAALKSAMTPASENDCEGWVATMHACMAHRGSSETAVELVLSLYAGRLQMYPADVAKAVCVGFTLRRDKPNWFPTLSELDEACEKAAEARTALAESVRQGCPSNPYQRQAA